MVERLVDSGLRGQLKSSSLLTGELYVDLDFYPERRAGDGRRNMATIEVIPTLPAPLEALTTKVTNILDKLDAIPLDQIGQDLSADGWRAPTRWSIRTELKQADRRDWKARWRRSARPRSSSTTEIAPELTDDPAGRPRATLKSAPARSSPRTRPLYIEMQRMFQEVSAAARSVRLMADYLERHPEALLKGKGGGDEGSAACATGWSRWASWRLMAGCASTPPSSFYTLSPLPAVAGSQAPTRRRDLAIGLGPVTFPVFLDRPQIVSRDAGNRLAVDEFNRWGGTLQDDFLRVWSENLAHLLGTSRILIFPSEIRYPLDFRIAADVLAFEGTPDGQAVLKVRWAVLDPISNRCWPCARTRYRQPAGRAGR